MEILNLFPMKMQLDNQCHIALVKGDVAGKGVLVRIHSECLTGDAFGSLRCDCGEQLAKALKRIESRRYWCSGVYETRRTGHWTS